MNFYDILLARCLCCNSGEESGGGGSSDFSTAQVTLISNASDTVFVHIAIAEEADPPFVPNSQTDTGREMGSNGDEATVTAILYKGYCMCSFERANALSGEGDVTTIHNTGAIITGDCTITIS